MELTKEQIKRINDFLEGIGIKYIDIRFEMVDHIASEIENKVDNKNLFFENKRFQTPFIKYLLSQKATYLKNYKEQKKKSFWVNTQKIVIDLFQQAVKPLNLMLTISFLTAVYYLEKFNIKYLDETIFVSFFVSFMYIAIKFNRFKKKFGEIRIIQTYVSFLMFNYIIAFHFHSSTSFFGENSSPFMIYKTAIMLILNFLVLMSFKNRKEGIEKQFNHLVL